MGDRLAHRERALVDVEVAGEQHGDDVGRRDRVRRRLRDRREDLVSRAAWWARSCAVRSAMPRNGRPCDGRTSVSAGSASNAASDARNRPSGSASGSIGLTATLVRSAAAACRRRSARRARASAATRAPASARGPRGCATTRRPSAMSSPSMSRVNDVGSSGSRARYVVAARFDRRAVPGQHAVPAEELDDRRRACSRRTGRRTRARSGTRRASSHRRAEARGEPRGVADVIGMAVGGDDAADRPAGRASSRSAAPRPRAWRASPKPQSTSVQPSASVCSHRLMWSSANGSGIRSQWSPGPISMVSPGPGGAAYGKSSNGGRAAVIERGR